MRILMAVGEKNLKGTYSDCEGKHTFTSQKKYGNSLYKWGSSSRDLKVHVYLIA